MLENRGAFNFSVFKTLLKARYWGGQIFGKIPAKSLGSPGADNKVEQQLGVAIIKKKKEKA